MKLTGQRIYEMLEQIQLCSQKNDKIGHNVLSDRIILGTFSH